MAEHKVYIGNLGPFIYDDAEDLEDPDGDFPAGTKRAAFLTTGATGATSGYSGTITLVTNFQISGTYHQIKTRAFTFSNGLVSSVGSESAWTTK